MILVCLCHRSFFRSPASFPRCDAMTIDTMATTPEGTTQIQNPAASETSAATIHTPASIPHAFALLSRSWMCLSSRSAVVCSPARLERSSTFTALPHSGQYFALSGACFPHWAQFIRNASNSYESTFNIPCQDATSMPAGYSITYFQSWLPASVNQY